MSLTIIEKTGTVSVTGMKPDRKPVTFDMTVLMGAQGELKADWTTEWFYITMSVSMPQCLWVKKGVDYLCHKLELDDFSGIGLDAIRRERKGAVETDLDDVYGHIGLCDGCCGEQEC